MKNESPRQPFKTSAFLLLAIVGFALTWLSGHQAGEADAFEIIGDVYQKQHPEPDGTVLFYIEDGIDFAGFMSVPLLLVAFVTLASCFAGFWRLAIRNAENRTAEVEDENGGQAPG